MGQFRYIFKNYSQAPGYKYATLKTQTNKQTNKQNKTEQNKQTKNQTNKNNNSNNNNNKKVHYAYLWSLLNFISFGWSVVFECQYLGVDHELLQVKR